MQEHHDLFLAVEVRSSGRRTIAGQRAGSFPALAHGCASKTCRASPHSHSCASRPASKAASADQARRPAHWRDLAMPVDDCLLLQSVGQIHAESSDRDQGSPLFTRSIGQTHDAGSATANLDHARRCGQGKWCALRETQARKGSGGSRKLRMRPKSRGVLGHVVVINP